MKTLTIEIQARAIPASNTKRVFINPKTRKPVIVDRAKGKSQQLATIKLFAQQAAADQGWKVTDAPIWLMIECVFVRPAGHFGTGRNSGIVKPSAPVWPTSKANGDRTNLLKSIEDALTGVVWRDDSQVVDGPIKKSYGDCELIRIVVRELDRYVSQER